MKAEVLLWILTLILFGAISGFLFAVYFFACILRGNEWVQWIGRLCRTGEEGK
jgi:hypothetical protein